MVLHSPVNKITVERTILPAPLLSLPEVTEIKIRWRPISSKKPMQVEDDNLEAQGPKHKSEEKIEARSASYRALAWPRTTALAATYTRIARCLQTEEKTVLRKTSAGRRNRIHPGQARVPTNNIRRPDISTLPPSHSCLPRREGNLSTNRLCRVRQLYKQKRNHNFTDRTSAQQSPRN